MNKVDIAFENMLKEAGLISGAKNAVGKLQRAVSKIQESVKTLKSSSKTISQSKELLKTRKPLEGAMWSSADKAERAVEIAKAEADLLNATNARRSLFGMKPKAGYIKNDVASAPASKAKEVVERAKAEAAKSGNLPAFVIGSLGTAATYEYLKRKGRKIGNELVASEQPH